LAVMESEPQMNADECKYQWRQGAACSVSPCVTAGVDGGPAPALTGVTTAGAALILHQLV
jgi:hypothetical protein